MSYTNHDELLDRMKPYGCVLKSYLSNHTPMVVEALAAMDAADEAIEWFDKNEDSILPKPPSQAPIQAEQWREHLADHSRFSDWVDFFNAEISEDGWRLCTQRWVARLSEGFISAACHGVIRVGHAVRALTVAETEARLRELSYALASWCVSYMTVAGVEPQKGPFNGESLIRNLPLLDSSLRENDGSITRAIEQLHHAPRILSTCNELSIDHPKQDLLAIAKVAASVFLNNAKTPLGAIVFTHGITGTAASLHLTPLLTEDEQRTIAAYTFQAILALHAVYAEKPLEDYQPGKVPTPEASRDAAISHGDDHAIKLTEACLLFYRLTDDEIFLAAADLGRDLIPAT